jgi:hypothetical protein
MTLLTAASAEFDVCCSEATSDAEKEKVSLRAPTIRDAPEVVTTANWTDSAEAVRRRVTVEADSTRMSAALMLSREASEERSVAFSAAPKEDTPASVMEEETVIFVTLMKPDGLTMQAAEPGAGADDPAGQLWQD